MTNVNRWLLVFCAACAMGAASSSAWANRYYSPEMGRFVSRDPVGYKEGMNLYQYVRSRPTMKLDMYGLDCSDHNSGCILAVDNYNSKKEMDEKCKGTPSIEESPAGEDLEGKPRPKQTFYLCYSCETGKDSKCTWANGCECSLAPRAFGGIGAKYICLCGLVTACGKLR